jgi:hypothetical protein
MEVRPSIKRSVALRIYRSVSLSTLDVASSGIRFRIVRKRAGDGEMPLGQPKESYLAH